MAVTYLHGVEAIEQKDGPVIISDVKTAVIGLIGISPIGVTNVPTLVSNPTDALQFGKEVPGFSIPQSLSAIFAQGAGTVIVVNVFDAATHTTQVTAEAQTLVAGKLKLAFAPIGAVTVLDAAGAATTYVKDTDYSLDEFGNFAVLSTAIGQTASLKFTYKKLNAAAITASVLIGTVDGTSGARTGMQCWDESLSAFSFNPKILIAPLYSSLSGISAALLTFCNKYRAISYLDAPYGTTPAQVIAGRGVGGTINFNTNSERFELLYPFLKRYDIASNSNQDFPYSAFKAGLRAFVDNEEGYWVSDSNHSINGIVGVERNISSTPSDPNSDANKLNEIGITTVFNFLTSGIKSWGNRSAAWPSQTKAQNFIVVRRTLDVLMESLEFYSLPFVDRPINQGLIDSIKAATNTFIRTLIKRGALLPGSECLYIPANNPPDQITLGRLRFDIKGAVPTPAERVTFNIFHDIQLYSQFK